MKLLPSLLYSDFEQFSERFRQCVELDEEIHIDFADGEFVANRLPSIDKVIQLPGKAVLEAHFMVQKPEAWVESALQDERFQTLIIHAEADVNISRMATLVRQAGRKIGLAIKPTTTLDQVTAYLPMIDQVLVLMVDPGFNGSPFIPGMVDKIRTLRNDFPQLIVEADGGMNPDTLLEVQAAGANRVAIGSYLHDKNLKNVLRELAIALKKGNQ
jgi:ribulose-phosphate 3-epimerase